jgi:Pretoxin HINT domain
LTARITSVLGLVTGRYAGRDLESWRKWWTEEQGYAYEPRAPRPRQDWTRSSDKPVYTENVHYSCFAAGTPVHTRGGLRPIESLQFGDQVLTADAQTGALGYQPVVAALHNKPALVLKIKLGEHEIKATPIHRFWKVGEGWVMARDLKPGDTLRAVGNTAVVNKVQSDRAEPVFNLTVMQSHSFFVGQRGMLVHDSSRIEPVVPFDAVPELAAR